MNFVRFVLKNVFFNRLRSLCIYKDNEYCIDFVILEEEIPIIKSILSSKKVAILNLKGNHIIRKICR